MSNKAIEFIKSKGLTDEYNAFRVVDKWEIKYNKNKCLSLFKNDKYYFLLCRNKNFNVYEFQSLVYKIADCLNCVAPDTSILNRYVITHQVCYNVINKEWCAYRRGTYIDASFIIDLNYSAVKIADILNKSIDLKEWMEGV